MISAQELSTLVAALVALLIALMAYVTAQLQQARLSLGRLHDGQQQLSEQISAGGRQSVSGPGPLARLAGPGLPGVVIPAAVIDQTREVLPDGQRDPYWATDCGESCVAEALSAYGLPHLDAGELRQQVHGQAGLGLTTANDLVVLLRSYHLHVDSYQLDGAQLRSWGQDCIGKRECLIVLGYWLAPSLLHWRLLVGANAEYALWDESWGGVRLATSWHEAARRYAGWVVRVHEKTQ